MREPRQYNGTPPNKMRSSMLEEKARYIVESAQVMRSHYCRTSFRRQYLPDGVHLADLYWEFVKCVDEEDGEKVPSHKWF